MKNLEDEFEEYQLPLTEQWFQSSRYAVQDPSLTSDAYRLLNYLCSNSKTWENYGSYIRKLWGWGEAKLTSAIRCLHNNNYINRKRIRRPDGKLGHYKYQYCQKPVFQNEKWDEPKKRDRTTPDELPNVDESCPKPDLLPALPVEAVQPAETKPGMARPAVANPKLPMPNKPMPNPKALKKALPSYFHNQKAMEAPPVQGRKFKRPDDEEDRFQMLLSFQIRDEKGEINEDALSYLANTYTRKKLEDTFYHLTYKLENESLSVKKSPIALYRHLLKHEHNCRTPNADLNEAFARKFAFELGWGSLEFKEKYVIDKNNPSKDIDFNLEPAVFRELLGSLYMNLHSNFGT